MTVLIELVDPHVTHLVRRAVLRDGIESERVDKAQDDDADTFHLAAFDSGSVAGVVSCAHVDGWQLYQMAVRSELQGQGIGRDLVLRLFEEVRSRGGHTVWANARDNALGFYEKLGFTVIEGGFEGWRGIPHHKVTITLSER
jgi:ribosomal protein S18 acetylase RimI-like enzyme